MIKVLQNPPQALKNSVLSLIILFFVSTLFLMLFSGCTPAAQSTLLSNYSACDSTLSSSCGSSQTSITGDLSLSFDSTQFVSHIDDSDLLEISGSCVDLGRKSNYIVVQVFESEDESQTPIIDNLNTINCQTNSSGLSGTCLLISTGIGSAPDGSTTPQFPKCFNGRFSFQVRLGKIMRQNPNGTKDDSTNAKVNYLVRSQIRTNEGVVASSDWAKSTILRDISKPTFTVTSNPSYARCDVNVDVAKFRDIRYNIKYSATGLGVGSGTVSGTIATDLAMSYPASSAGAGPTNYWHTSLMPGVKYTYSVEAVDYVNTYTYTPAAVETSGYGTGATCELPAPTNSTVTDGTNCTVALINANVAYNYQWKFSTDSSFTTNTSVTSTAIGGCSNAISCNTTKAGLGGGKLYYVAARAYVDTNGNSTPDAGELVGGWSSVATCTFN